MRTTYHILVIAITLFLSNSVMAQSSHEVDRRNLAKANGQKQDNKSSSNSVKSDTLSKSALVDGKLYDAYLANGDTVPMVSLPAVKVQKKRIFKNKRARRKYLRLERHVRKVYPFAKLANEKLVAYERSLQGMTDARRKKFMRAAERDIRKEFSNDLKALTFTQGRILLKLIDRETGAVSYDLVKDLRGGFTAWIFQGVARMFDFNLKSEYDPETDDKLIEEIVQKIEQEEFLQDTVCD